MNILVMIAQILYYMSIHEKTQPRRILTPRLRSEYMKTLKIIRSLIIFMQSRQALSVEGGSALCACINSTNGIFPSLDAGHLKMLRELNCAPPSDEVWRDDWNMVFDAMIRIVNSTECNLSKLTTLTNRIWIKSFMAFHNLPRVFFLSDQIGLWSEPIPPVGIDFALESVKPFINFCSEKD